MILFTRPNEEKNTHDCPFCIENKNFIYSRGNVSAATEATEYSCDDDYLNTVWVREWRREIHLQMSNIYTAV